MAKDFLKEAIHKYSPKAPESEHRFEAPEQGPVRDLEVEKMKEVELQKAGEAVSEAITRLLESSGNEGKSREILDMVDKHLKERPGIRAQQEELESFLAQNEAEITEQAKFYLKAKIHLLKLQQQ